MDERESTRGWGWLLTLNIVIGAGAALWGRLLGLLGDACNTVDAGPGCDYPTFMTFVRIGPIVPIVIVVVTSVLAFGFFRGRRTGLILLACCSPVIVVATIVISQLATAAATAGL